MAQNSTLSFENATDTIDYPLTDDFIFRAVLQRNNQVLFSTYLLTNQKTGKIYSSKFCIHMVDLFRIDLATEEDIHYQIDQWAKLFKVRTWEELYVIAKNNPDLLQACNDLYTIN